MRLSSFRIRNFKSIIDTGDCNLSATDNILVLAGQNEAGKSAVLEALNFFANGPSEDFDRLHRRRHDPPHVTCQFRLDDTDIKNIEVETENTSLVNHLKKNPLLSFLRGEMGTENIDAISLCQSALEDLKQFFPAEELEENEEVSPDADGEPEGEEEEGEEEDEEDEEEEHVPRNSLEHLERFLCSEIRRFVFYDAFTDLLPDLVLISDIEKYPAVQDFQKVFGVDFKKIVLQDQRAIARAEQRINENASDNLNTYWRQRLEEGGRYRFLVRILPKEPPEAASEIQFLVDRNDEDPLYLGQKSKGFRWFSAFNLRLRSLGVDEVSIRNLVILIDEPGQGLHERAQKDVKRVIEELGETGAQIIYATHHPCLIGIEGVEFARLRLVSNLLEHGTRVDTVSQFAGRAKQGAIDTLSPVITAMGIHSAHGLIDKNRFNVLVEGISDHYYFCAFQKLFDYDERIYFLPASGASNIPNLVSLLIGWGYNYRAVFDDEQGSGRRAYNLLKSKFYEGDDDLTHKYVLKIRGCNGIEDIFKRDDFFRFVLEKEVDSMDQSVSNSKYVQGRKELLARMFLEKVEAGDLVLSESSREKIREVFDWIYEMFQISQTKNA